MARTGDTLGDPVSGARVVFRETAAETGGALLRLELRAAPRWSAGPAHVHPQQEERIEIVAGALRSRVARAKRRHAPGEVVRVPAGTPHTIWNAGDDEMRLVVEFRPALRMEELFETAIGLGRTRTTTKPVLELARLLLATRVYRDEFRLARPAFPDKRRLTTALGRYAVNPVVKLAIALRVVPPGYALLETIGRRSGKPRRTPVGYAREGDAVWIVAEHGHRAGYVRNIEANPNVWVMLAGRWRSGSARTVPDDDAAERLERVGTAVSRAVVRAMRTDLLTVRVDLDR